MAAHNPNYIKSQNHKNENIYKIKYTTYQAPKEMDFFKNTEEVIHFINSVSDHKPKQHKIKIDLSQVESFSHEGLITFTKLISHLTSQGIGFEGNTPKEKESRDFFLYSGFYKFVQSSHKHKESNKNILSVINGALYSAKI